MRRTLIVEEVVSPVMSQSFPAAAGPPPPTVVGRRPRVALLVAVVAGALAACSNSSSDQVTSPDDLGMTSTMMAYYSDENLTMYEVQTPVPFPVRKPSAEDSKALGPAPSKTPYPHAPFLLASDESIEVHYTISNVDDQDHAVWMLIDPWNEFVRWNPGVTIVDDDETSPNWGYDLAFIVPAKSRVQGTITQDDMQEIAIKLASVENLFASAQAMQAMGDAGADPNAIDPTTIANNIFNPQNRSNSGDAIYTPWIPPVIAGLTGFDLGLRTMEQANVAIEITALDMFRISMATASLRPTIRVTRKASAPPPTTLSPSGAMF